MGELTLASSDPRDYPIINPNFLSEEEEIDHIYQGVQFVLSLNQTEALANFTPSTASTPECDDYENLSKDWWYCFIRQNSISVKMSNDFQKLELSLLYFYRASIRWVQPEWDLIQIVQ